MDSVDEAACPWAIPNDCFRGHIPSMKSHAAVVMPGAGQPLRIQEFKTPFLEPGAALLRTLYSEVCGTDVHLHRGRLDVPFPIIPGHVSVGVIELAGSKLRD